MTRTRLFVRQGLSYGNILLDPRRSERCASGSTRSSLQRWIWTGSLLRSRSYSPPSNRPTAPIPGDHGRVILVFGYTPTMMQDLGDGLDGGHLLRRGSVEPRLQHRALPAVAAPGVPAIAGAGLPVVSAQPWDVGDVLPQAR